MNRFFCFLLLGCCVAFSGCLYDYNVKSDYYRRSPLVQADIPLPGADQIVFSVDDCIRLVLSNNPDIDAARADSAMAKYAVDIALADAEGDTVQVATDIVHCLEERCLSEDYGGVVSTLADPKMYAEYLHIAFAILAKEDEESKGGPMEFAKCAFNLHGMHMLMARLTQVLSWEGVIMCSHESSPSKQLSAERKEYFQAMRLAFCKGLMRIEANPQSTAAKKTNSTKKKGIEMTLEEEMELMLSPCI